VNDSVVPLSLPATERSADDWTDWVARRCDDSLTRTRELVAQLKREPGDAASTMRTWNDANLALANAFAVSSLMCQVHPAEAVRTRAEQGEHEDRAGGCSVDLLHRPDTDGGRGPSQPGHHEAGEGEEHPARQSGPDPGHQDQPAQHRCTPVMSTRNPSRPESTAPDRTGPRDIRSGSLGYRRVMDDAASGRGERRHE